MALLTLAEAEQIAGRGRPWTFRLEFCGSNPSNVSGQSDKFWYATGRGLAEPVEAGWGANGNAPQFQLIDWTELRIRVADKLAKGYDYADTPFVRMSPANLAVVMGVGAQAVTQAVPVTATNATAGSTSAVLITAPVLVGKPPAASLVALGTPWSLICGLRVLLDGTKVKAYSAFDAQGKELLQLDPAAGIAFAQQHNVDVAF